MILQEYLNYTSNSEAPESYHIWVFLSMVAGVLGKKTWIKCNYFTVFPNMYVILISLPGVGKKSTAMRIGRQVVEEADVRMKLTYDAITPQALIGELEDSFYLFEQENGKPYGSSPVTAIASELITLLSGGATMVEFLTDIYDSDKMWKYKTKGCGENIIINPCLNIISGVTTVSFCNRIIKDAVAGGFISRSIIIYDNDMRVESPFSLPTAAQMTSRDRVIDRFKDIANLCGETTFDYEAKTYFESWYVEEMTSMAHKTAYLEFHSRKAVHVLKCAMLIAASEVTNIITLEYLKMAIELLRRVEHNMKFVYMSAGANKHGDIFIRILSALQYVDEIDYKDLLALFMRDISQEEFDEQLATLDAVNYITDTLHPGKGSYRIIAITDKGKAMFEKYKDK